MKKKQIFLTVILIISLGFAYWVIRKFDLSVILKLNYSTVIYLMLIFSAYQISGIYSIVRILSAMGYRPPRPTLYMILTASASMNYTGLMKVSLPMRIFLLNKIFEIPVSAGISSNVLTYTLDAGLMLVISLVGIPVFLPSFNFKIVIMVFVLFLIIVGTTVAVFLKFQRHIGKKIKKLGDFLENIRQAVKSISRIDLLILIFLSLARRVLFALGTFLILLSLNHKVGFPDLFYIQAISTFIGFISMIPMGLGTKDISMIFLLARIGVVKEAAISVVLIERTLWSLLPFIMGIISANLLGIRYLKDKPAVSKQEGVISE